MIKALKNKTAKRYTVKQLYKHLDRILTKLDSTQFRIDYQYEKVFIWDEYDRRYKLWSCMNPHERNSAIGAILMTYDDNNIRHDFEQDTI
jgi:hypothetical protein